MNRRASIILGAGLIWLLSARVQMRAQDSPPTEYQIKAAFLLNFAKFVRWPAAALPAPDSPIVIGILGESPFHEDLAKIIRNKLIDEHPLAAREFHSAAEAANCHILFICTSEKSRLPDIIRKLKGASVLTVGETDQFIEDGGMINFVLEGTKVRFQINSGAASAAGLKISAKLMSLAVASGR